MQALPAIVREDYVAGNSHLSALFGPFFNCFLRKFFRKRYFDLKINFTYNLRPRVKQPRTFTSKSNKKNQKQTQL